MHLRYVATPFRAYHILAESSLEKIFYTVCKKHIFSGYQKYMMMVVPINNLFTRKIKILNSRGALLTQGYLVAKFIIPDWGDIVDSGKWLS